MAQKSTGKKVRGVLFRRGVWWCRWFEGGRERIERCDSKSQAVLRHAKHRADIREGIFFPRKSAKQDVTLRAWIARYLADCTNKGKSNEVRYGRWWSLYLGGRLLTEITIEELRRAQSRMRAKRTLNTTTRQLQRHWADSTINRYFSFIRHVLALAAKDGHIARNPASAVTLFPEQNRTRFLSEGELRRLHGVMEPEDWRLVAFAVESGLRQGEQFSCRWDQVDLENGVLTLPMPKGGRTRHVPLSEGAKTILRSFGSFASSPFVFPSVRDPLKALCPDSFLTNIFRPSLRRAGIQGATWHSLRHTCASRKVMAGADLLAVKELLGHRDFETTLRYAHLSPKHLRETVNLGSLGGLLHPGAETVARTVAEDEGSEAGSVQPVERMVRPEGLEPPTPRSVVWCSIH